MNVQRAAVDVEVSIVTLCGGAQLSRCLAAVPAACAGVSWRLTLVDNSASGLVLSHLLCVMPAATVVRSEGRRGFGANQNLVLTDVVGERRARYALVLNDDAELDPDSVAALVRYADEHPRVGVVGPVMRGSDDIRLPSLFPWPTLANQASSTAFPGRPVPAVRQGWIDGACMLLRTAALAQVGLFDPRYFLFYEDTDLCRRMTRAGWQAERCVDAAVVHRRHQTTTRTTASIEIDQQMLRSRYLYFQKHHGRVMARALNGLVRCGLAARTVKGAVETAVKRGSNGSAATRSLYALMASRPSHPTRLEAEARANAENEATTQRVACRTGRS